MGYPVLLKPSAGGGGKGMRMVRTPRELQQAMTVCRSEARAAFGDDSLYLEKWLQDNRHVEVQVVVDRYGNAVHVGDRDCSVQRRHQKIVEEAPTPALDEASRQGLAEQAVRAVVAAGYENLGTLEFLVDQDGAYYFIEINCRIQVEHPVTEMLSGIDLVAEQIRIAAGEPLGYTQADVQLRGHAIEFRINAEDVRHDFRPGAGTVERYLSPGGPWVRMDSHMYAGYEVPPYYDSLLASWWSGARTAPVPSSAPGSRWGSWCSMASSPTSTSTGRSWTVARSWTARSPRTSSTGSAARRSCRPPTDPAHRPAMRDTR